MDKKKIKLDRIIIKKIKGKRNRKRTMNTRKTSTMEKRNVMLRCPTMHIPNGLLSAP